MWLKSLWLKNRGGGGLAVSDIIWFLYKSETKNVRNPFVEWIHFLHPFCCIISFFLQGSICGNKSLPAWSIGAIVPTFPGAICQACCASRLFGSVQLLPDSEGGERHTVICRWIDQLQTAGNEALYRHYRNDDQTSIALAWLWQRSLFTIEVVIKKGLGPIFHRNQWKNWSSPPAQVNDFLTDIMLLFPQWITEGFERASFTHSSPIVGFMGVKSLLNTHLLSWSLYHQSRCNTKDSLFSSDIRCLTPSNWLMQQRGFITLSLFVCSYTK